MSAILEKSTNDETITVTVNLPKATFDRAEKLAIQRHKKLPQVLTDLVIEGVERRAILMKLWDEAKISYATRRAQEGKAQQSDEDVLTDLRDLRERIAGEKYPAS